MKCRLSLEDGDNADVRSVLQKYEASSSRVVARHVHACKDAP